MSPKKHAMFSVTSLPGYHQAEVFGTIWHYSVIDCRNSAVGVPMLPFYGSDRESPLFIGWDTEFTPEPPAIDDGRKVPGSNHVLSYQFFVLGARSHWSGIHFTSEGKRIKVNRFLGSAIMIGLEAELITRWPKSAYLFGHFSLADLPGFKGSDILYRRTDAVRRTFVTIGDAIPINCWDETRHAHRIRVTVRDSMLLAPAGKQSLSAVGDMLGLPKLQLDEGVISNMDAFRRKDPAAFASYAIRDAEISAIYCRKMLELNQEVNGIAKVPATLSSIALNHLFVIWAKLGINANAVLGRETIVEEIWTGKYTKKVPRSVSTADASSHESFATECYHGGRNEQYLFGAGTAGTWTDYDLCGAYTTGLAVIGMPLWQDIRQTRDVDEFQPETLGFARCEFEFSEDTRFPCLPVRTQAGLLFPFRGETYCAAPEIYLARKMGARLRIITGVIVPCDYSVRPFSEFVAVATRRRQDYPKGSLDELFWKELGNSLYGKTAQGLRPKRAYSPRKDAYEQLPPSKITNAYFAAYVTSFVRAVLGEVLASLPPHAEVCNATTDGFLSTATDREVFDATRGPLCSIFAAARYLVTGKREVVDIKHRIVQPLGWRTRGQATLEALEGEKPVLAKAGLKPPMADKGDQNEWIINQFLTRDGDSYQHIKSLRTLPDICRHGGDLVPNELVRRISMDFDWKRQPVEIGLTPIRGVAHLSFNTKPWPTAFDAMEMREQWANYWKSNRRPLKTLEDMSDFESYRALADVPPEVRKPKKGGVKKLAWRMVLRAFTQSLAGLDRTEMTYPELADYLTGHGYPSKREDLENAARARFAPNSVPCTPETIKLMDVIKGRFTDFQPEMILSDCPRPAAPQIPITLID